MKFVVDAVVRNHAVGMLILVLLAFAMCQPLWLIGLGPLLFVRMVWARHPWWREAGFGVPNAITAGRMSLVAVLGGLSPQAGVWSAALAMVIFALDGLDGWFARKLNQQSEFGAAFDMEVDAYFVAVLSLGLWRMDVAGLWIVLPAILRYVWVLTVFAFGEPHERPRTRLTRHAFAILVCSLAIGYLPLGWFSTFAAAFGTVTVCISFGTSFAAFRSH